MWHAIPLCVYVFETMVCVTSVEWLSSHGLLLYCQMQPQHPLIPIKRRQKDRLNHHNICHFPMCCFMKTWSEFVHKQWHRRCTKVSLGHRAGLREWYPTAKRRHVMVRNDRRRPVWWISWTINLGLDRKDHHQETSDFPWCGNPRNI